MSRFNVKVEHVSNYTEYITDKVILGRMLDGYEILHAKLWDKFYYYYSFEDWLRVFADILANMPKYAKEKFDCDNFALLTCARVMEKYHVNGCGIAIGDSPMGYHAWNIIITETELFYMEPQTGKILDLVGEGYTAHYVVWG